MSFMLDTTNVADIPADTPASTVLAGYVDGAWQSFAPIVAAFPHNPHVSIAVLVGSKAIVVDCETGDLTPFQAAQALQRSDAQTIYCSEAVWSSVEFEVANLGLLGATYWIASWFASLPAEPPTIPSDWLQRGCVAWQYANPDITGSNLDYSVTDGSWPLPKGITMASAIEVIRNLTTGDIATIFTESNEGHLQQWTPPNITGAGWRYDDISASVPEAAPLAL